MHDLACPLRAAVNLANAFPSQQEGVSSVDLKVFVQQRSEAEAKTVVESDIPVDRGEPDRSRYGLRVIELEVIPVGHEPDLGLDVGVESSGVQDQAGIDEIRRSSELVRSHRGEEAVLRFYVVLGAHQTQQLRGPETEDTAREIRRVHD